MYIENILKTLQNTGIYILIDQIVLECLNMLVLAVLERISGSKIGFFIKKIALMRGFALNLGEILEYNS